MMAGCTTSLGDVCAPGWYLVFSFFHFIFAGLMQDIPGTRSIALHLVRMPVLHRVHACDFFVT